MFKKFTPVRYINRAGGGQKNIRSRRTLCGHPIVVKRPGVMPLLLLEKRLREMKEANRKPSRGPVVLGESELLDFITPHNREIMERKIESLWREKETTE